MDSLLKYIISITILITSPDLACSQTQASKERKLIIGTWLVEDKSYQLDFQANGECFVYFPSMKLHIINTYRISDTMPDCIPKEDMIIDPKEKVTFLEMIDKKDGFKLCYEINGITATVLSIRPLGRGGYTLFDRKK